MSVSLQTGTSQRRWRDPDVGGPEAGQGMKKVSPWLLAFVSEQDRQGVATRMESCK